MQRLQTDYVDLYYLHRINLDIPVEEVAEYQYQAPDYMGFLPHSLL